MQGWDKIEGNTFKVFYAQVMNTDVDDATGEGAGFIQFKISPYMDGWTHNPPTESHLPFAQPLTFMLGATANSGKVSVPLPDSFVYVTNLYGQWYYFADARPTNYNLAMRYYDEIQDKLGELDNILAPDLEYPDAITFHYESGICVIYSQNTDKPIFAIYHPEDSYFIIDADGNIGSYAVNYELKNTEGVWIYTEDKNLHFEDGNGNMVDTTDEGITVTDTNDNTIVTDSAGMEFTDLNGNVLTMDSNGINFEDANGNKIERTASGILIECVNGNKIELTASGIKMTDLSGNTVEMNAGGVNINNGNLQVLP